MRKILEEYYKTGRVNQRLLNELNLNEPHALLSEEKPEAKEVKKTDYDLLGRDRLVELLEERDKKIENLNRELTQTQQRVAM